MERSSDRIWRRDHVEEMDKIFDHVHGKRKRQISPTFLFIQKTQRRNTQISSNYNKRRYFYTYYYKVQFLQFAVRIRVAVLNELHYVLERNFME